MEVALIEIVPFKESHQAGIDELFRAIGDEFSEQVFPDNAKPIIELSKEANRVYWVALSGESVIGTVGLLYFNSNTCALKSMFLAERFRSDKREIAKQLLQTAIDRAMRAKCKHMYLGTMAQFKGAQRFYEKHGFLQIKWEELPDNFPGNTVDTVFYRKLF